MSRGHADAAPADYVFLSPHLDDAALSCGGTIHRLHREGHRVLVVTICAGTPASSKLSPYAMQLHERWGGADFDPDQMVAQRRAEDRAALALLGSAWHHLEVPDAPYRTDPDSGAWLYEGDEAIFGDIAAGDTKTVTRIAEELRRLFGRPVGATDGSTARHGVVVYAPLTVGRHVDHQLVRRAAEQLAAEGWTAEPRAIGQQASEQEGDRQQAGEQHAVEPQGVGQQTGGRHDGGQGPIMFYEDIPYAADDDAVTEAVGAWQDAEPTPFPSRFTATDLDAKVEAVAAYSSQISTFWASVDAMEEAVRDLALRRGKPGRPAERLWVRAETASG